MRSDTNYNTQSLILAVYLFTKDQQIAEINAVDDSGKKEVSFIRTPHLEELIELYKFGNRSHPELLVPVHRYEQARRELLDRLKE